MIEVRRTGGLSARHPESRARRLRRIDRRRARMGRLLRPRRPRRDRAACRSSSRRCATRASTPPATTTCATRSRAPSATCRTRSGSGTAPSSIAPTPPSTARSARPSNARRPGDLLLVVSGFGMQPVSPVKHFAARVLRDPDVSGTHEHAPDGFLLAYGDVRVARPQAARLDRRRHADDPLFPRRARSAATWTATRAPTLRRARSRPSGRSRSFRHTDGE